VDHDGVHGLEPWISNGTTAGTILLKDINTGAGSGLSTLYPAVGAPIIRGVAFFAANNGVNGFELWKSNGSAAGTVLVKDIRPGALGSNPLNLTNVNGTLFFSANNGVNGVELWMTNGTPAGTLLVKDIDPGSASSNPSFLTNINNTLFFTANDGVHGVEPWVLGPVPLATDASTPPSAMSPSSVDAALVSAPQAPHPTGSTTSSTGSGPTATENFAVPSVVTDGDSGSITKAGVSDGGARSTRVFHTPTPQNDNLAGVAPWGDDL
jgi:ELWxxDGT repeat protein